MASYNPPEPIVNSRERRRFSELKNKYEDFRSPNFFGRQANRMKSRAASAGRKLQKRVPGLGAAQKSMKKMLKEASDKQIVKQALSKAAKGGGLVLRWCAQGTLSKSAVHRRLESNGIEAAEFEHICGCRSYEIADLADKDWKSRWGAALQGIGTGALGGARGVGLNLALSTVLFLRATQRVALHYGYDAVNREEEQVIASKVALQSLQPDEGPATGSTGSLLGKMMAAGEISALKKALKHSTYQEMAQRGGAQLLYTKLRATANKAAQSALNKAGKEGFETTLVRRLLRDLGERIPKRVGQRVVPIVGGLIGGCIDTKQMQQVITGANLIYHKRFIAEKEERVLRLTGEEEQGAEREDRPPSPTSGHSVQEDNIQATTGEEALDEEGGL